MTASLAMCLEANGVPPEECSTEMVNKVMGARPMKGAAWEDALAASQHYGMRATLTTPSTIRQLRAWTDAGIPVMIAWNPEGRPWSHASVVYHVTEGPITTVDSSQTIIGDGPGLYVWVADPNIPNPDKTTRIVQEDEFYSRWYEKWPDYLVRRPACAIEQEVTSDGRQVMASSKTRTASSKATHAERLADQYLAARKSRKPSEPVQPKKEESRSFTVQPDRGRDDAARDLAEGRVNIRKGPHANKPMRGKGEKGKGKAQRHPKHKQDLRDRAGALADAYLASKQADMANGRLDRTTRSKINKALVRGGLDGNGRFRKPEQAYSKAIDILGDFGIELDTVVSSHLFQARPSGTLNVDVAFTNEADRFSPVSIVNSTLYLQFTELREGAFETVAYMS